MMAWQEKAATRKTVFILTRAALLIIVALALALLFRTKANRSNAELEESYNLME